MKLNFMSFSDDGHGWLRVRKYLVQDLLGITNISNCSYEKNGWLYLEEDCDAPKFLKRLDELNHVYNVKHRRTQGQSSIRSFNRVSKSDFFAEKITLNNSKKF